MTTPVNIATADQVGEVAALVADAFAVLEVARWLVPEDHAERVAALTGQFTVLIEHAHRYGRVETIRDGALVAASVWIDYTTVVPEPPDYDRRLLEAVGDRLERFAILDTAFGKHHPEAAHHHLAFLAVAPNRQGVGLGTALLDSHHARLDRLGVPAYLEASNTRNRELYRRHGYRSRDEVLQLPDGPAMYPMWRDPSLPSERSRNTADLRPSTMQLLCGLWSFNSTFT